MNNLTPLAAVGAVARLLALSGIIAGVPAFAQEGPIVVLSEGQTTCGEYVAEPQKRVVRGAWVLGFISGVNAGMARNGSAPEAERMAGRSFQQPATVDGWLQIYCSAHPLDGLVTAAEKLRRDFIEHERVR